MDSFREISGVLTVIMSTLVFVPLLISTAHSKLKPHPITWAIASLTSGVSALIFVCNNAGAGAWAPISQTILSTALTIVSFHYYRKSSRITRQDMFFFFLAIMALILWLLSRDLAAVSVVLLQVATVLGFVPTFTKTWKRPRSESYYTYTIFLLMNVFGILATVNLDFVNLFNRVANLPLNSSMILIMVFRRRKIPEDKESVEEES